MDDKAEAAQSPNNKSRFMPGNIVRIADSQGVVDDGWRVAHQVDDGRMKIVKVEGVNRYERLVPLDELAALNKAFHSATTWEELYDLINRAKHIKGSQGIYNSADLIGIIEQVKKGGMEIGNITNTGNIRDTVRYLMTSDTITNNFQEKAYKEMLAKSRSPLEKYILEGLWMIAHKIDTQKYFSDDRMARALKVGHSPGEFYFVEKLTKLQDLDFELTRAASHMRRFPGGGIEVGGYYMPANYKDHPEKYRPDLVLRMQYEIGLLGAEEWLHELQHQLGGSLAGEPDNEADIAAYYDSLGLTLSDHFLSRYSSRMDWDKKRQGNSD